MDNIVLDTNCLVQSISSRSPYRPIWSDESIGENTPQHLSVEEKKILQDIKEGLSDVKFGKTYPAEDVFNSIKVRFIKETFERT